MANQLTLLQYLGKAILCRICARNIIPEIYKAHRLLVSKADTRKFGVLSNFDDLYILVGNLAKDWIQVQRKSYPGFQKFYAIIHGSVQNVF